MLNLIKRMCVFFYFIENDFCIDPYKVIQLLGLVR